MTVENIVTTKREENLSNAWSSHSSQPKVIDLSRVTKRKQGHIPHYLNIRRNTHLLARNFCDSLSITYVILVASRRWCTDNNRSDGMRARDVWVVCVAEQANLTQSIHHSPRGCGKTKEQDGFRVYLMSTRLILSIQDQEWTLSRPSPSSRAVGSTRASVSPQSHFHLGLLAMRQVGLDTGGGGAGRSRAHVPAVVAVMVMVMARRVMRVVVIVMIEMRRLRGRCRAATIGTLLLLEVAQPLVVTLELIP